MKPEARAEPLSTAQEILIQVAQAQAELAWLGQGYEADLARVRQAWRDRLESAKGLLRSREAELLRHLKANRGAIFGDGDSVRVETGEGALTCEMACRVRRPRGVDLVPVLERLGLTEAVVMAKSPDWELIETYSPERLISIGLERITERRYGWETAPVEATASPEDLNQPQGG